MNLNIILGFFLGLGFFPTLIFWASMREERRGYGNFWPRLPRLPRWLRLTRLANIRWHRPTKHTLAPGVTLIKGANQIHQPNLIGKTVGQARNIYADIFGITDSYETLLNGYPVLHDTVRLKANDTLTFSRSLTPPSQRPATDADWFNEAKRRLPDSSSILSIYEHAMAYPDCEADWVHQHKAW